MNYYKKQCIPGLTLFKQHSRKGFELWLSLESTPTGDYGVELVKMDYFEVLDCKIVNYKFYSRKPGNVKCPHCECTTFASYWLRWVTYAVGEGRETTGNC